MRMKTVLKILLLVPALSFADIRPLPLASAANTNFADENADDKKGGWIDLGGNDLRDIPMGDLLAAGVPFSIQEKGGKSCIVLGGPTRSYLPKTATLDVAEAKGSCTNLYLLHAAAFPPAVNGVAGVLTVEYATGKPTEFRVRFGRDVADWQKPTGYANAARAWTVYNGNTQVSLFTSKFALSGAPVKRVRFEAKEATWMIVGASIGDDTPLRPFRPPVQITRTFTSPPPLTPPPPPPPNNPPPPPPPPPPGPRTGPGAPTPTPPS
ncbi:MAG: hypothetical protein FWH21_07770, partial [Kiritimatiellaeota bacterium]|nr:hypothetical protein [Kiritimatiellota bacterium]